MASLACWSMWNLSYTILHCGAHCSMLSRNGSHLSTQAASIRPRCRAIQFGPEEFIQRLLLAFPAKPERLAGCQIAHHGQELVLLALVDLIHPDLPQHRFARWAWHRSRYRKSMPRTVLSDRPMRRATGAA